VLVETLNRAQSINRISASSSHRQNTTVGENRIIVSLIVELTVMWWTDRRTHSQAVLSRPDSR